MSYTIAVSGINAIDNPGPGTGIAKSLRESDLDVRIIGLAYDCLEPGIYMDWLIDKSYILPYPSGEVDSFLSRLQYIHERENLDVIIPALDAELPVYMNLSKSISSLSIGMMIPSKQSFQQRAKDKLPELSAAIGLKIPQTFVLSTLAELDKALAELGYPLMVKGPFYEAYTAENRQDAHHHFHALCGKWGYPIIVQEFIHGDEYNLVGLGDGKGNDVGHVSTKKMLITKLGKVWTNVSIRNDPMEQAALKFVNKYHWSGGYELELMLDKKSQEMYLIEINPRFPAWLYAATGCGINLPERMVKMILGKPYKTDSDYPVGKMLIRYTGELIKDISDFEKITTTAES
jgi:carbamoyl-phosphate synthase large subunit